MKNIYGYIILLSFNVFSQNAVLEIDTNLLRIGEQFNAVVKVYGLESDDVLILSDTVFSKLELISESSLLEKDSYVYKNFLLTSFDTGNFVIDSLIVLASEKDTLFTNSLDVSFVPVQLDTSNNFFDVKPPKNIPFLAKELLQYIPYFILFIVCIGCVFLLLKYFKTKKNIESISNISSIPIDVYFLEKIDTLKTKKYLKNRRYKDFYTELSEIFRGYLEVRFNIPALESSTYELKELLSSIKINESWLNSFFRNSDITKFAKGVPSDKDSMLFLLRVEEFIVNFGVSETEKVLNSDQSHS